MAIWTEYTTKNVPEDEDTLMIYDSSGGENKQLPVSGMSEKIVNDALQKELDIETENKTIPSAVNELHVDIEELVDGTKQVGDAKKVNGHTVNSDVPENAVFTDTVYDDTKVREDIGQIKGDIDELNTLKSNNYVYRPVNLSDGGYAQSTGYSYLLKDKDINGGCVVYVKVLNAINPKDIRFHLFEIIEGVTVYKETKTGESVYFDLTSYNYSRKFVVAFTGNVKYINIEGFPMYQANTDTFDVGSPYGFNVVFSKSYFYVDVYSVPKIDTIEHELENSNKRLGTIENEIGNFGIELKMTSADTPIGSIPQGEYWGYKIPISAGSVIKGFSFSNTTDIQKGTVYFCYKNESNFEVDKSISFIADENHYLELSEYYTVTKDDLYVVFVLVSGTIRYACGGSGNYNLIEFTKSENVFTVKQSLNGCSLFFSVIYMKTISDRLNSLESREKGVGSGNVITVMKDGKGDFATINDALNYAYTIESSDNPITIIIHSGVYNEVCNVLGNHYVSLIGVNRNDCIIRDDSGIYSNCPLRIEGNAMVKNLTLIATHKNNSSLVVDGVVQVNTAYGLHIDDRHADNDNDYKITVENCYIYSEQNPAVGIGLDKNQTVELINCELVSNIADDVLNATGSVEGVWGWKPNGGALFYHALYSGNYTSDEGYQKLVVKDCIIRNNAPNVAVGEGGGMEEQVTLEFINNVGYSTNNGTSYVKGLSGATISPFSYGNNCEAMNYHE